MSLLPEMHGPLHLNDVEDAWHNGVGGFFAVFCFSGVESTLSQLSTYNCAHVVVMQKGGCPYPQNKGLSQPM